MVLTEMGDTIDTIFFDRREAIVKRDHRFPGNTGKYLVICCEGNSGFYETGIVVAPLDKGFSVLGFNAPGIYSRSFQVLRIWRKYG